MSNPNPTSIRIDETTETEITKIAVDTGASRSLVLRAMIAVAQDHKGEVVARIRSQL